MVRRATGRGDDQDSFVAVGKVAERGGVRSAGPRSDGGQQEQPGSLERTTDPPAVGTELLDDLLVEIDDHSLFFLQGWVILRTVRGPDENPRWGRMKSPRTTSTMVREM